ncbi:single-stranded DNA-binding protein [Pseudomonadales bacterium]|nr:single-stranded DNA-binding protein [Pseudomonadales bacterium]
MSSKTRITGHIGREPELKTVGESQLCSFSVAVSEGWGSNKKTVWYGVNEWGKNAQPLSESLAKGEQVVVEGTIETDKDGRLKVFKRKDGTFSANLSLRCYNGVFRWNTTDQTTPESPQETVAAVETPVIDEDDIPF